MSRIMEERCSWHEEGKATDMRGNEVRSMTKRDDGEKQRTQKKAANEGSGNRLHARGT